ncbi:MAG: hypothetical protein ABGX05_20345 [Pirellulaceae bacterium]
MHLLWQMVIEQRPVWDLDAGWFRTAVVPRAKKIQWQGTQEELVASY